MAINIRAYSRDSDTSAGVGNAIIQQHHATPGVLRGLPRDFGVGPASHHQSASAGGQQQQPGTRGNRGNNRSDVSIQVDVGSTKATNSGGVGDRMGRTTKNQRGASGGGGGSKAETPPTTSQQQQYETALYSREDIREQYCINKKETDVLDRSSHVRQRAKGFFGCLTSRKDHGAKKKKSRSSFFSALCVRRASEENLYNGCNKPVANTNRSVTLPALQPFTVPLRDDGSNQPSLFRNRPQSFCTTDPRRFSMQTSTTPCIVNSYAPRHSDPDWKISTLPVHRTTSDVPHDTEISGSNHPFRYGGRLAYTQPNTPELSAALYRRQVMSSEALLLDDRRSTGSMSKHVSFDASSPCSEIYTSAVPANASKSQERLLDGRKTPEPFLESKRHPHQTAAFSPVLARAILLERLRQASMRSQATQTEGFYNSTTSLSYPSCYSGAGSQVSIPGTVSTVTRQVQTNFEPRKQTKRLTRSSSAVNQDAEAEGEAATIKTEAEFQSLKRMPDELSQSQPEEIGDYKKVSSPERGSGGSPSKQRRSNRRRQLLKALSEGTILLDKKRARRFASGYVEVNVQDERSPVEEEIVAGRVLVHDPTRYLSGSGSSDDGSLNDDDLFASSLPAKPDMNRSLGFTDVEDVVWSDSELHPHDGPPPHPAEEGKLLQAQKSFDSNASCPDTAGNYSDEFGSTSQVTVLQPHSSVAVRQSGGGGSDDKGTNSFVVTCDSDLDPPHPPTPPPRRPPAPTDPPSAELSETEKEIMVQFPPWPGSQDAQELIPAPPSFACSSLNSSQLPSADEEEDQIVTSSAPPLATAAPDIDPSSPNQQMSQRVLLRHLKNGSKSMSETITSVDSDSSGRRLTEHETSASSEPLSPPPSELNSPLQADVNNSGSKPAGLDSTDTNSDAFLTALSDHLTTAGLTEVYNTAMERGASERSYRESDTSHNSTLRMDHSGVQDLPYESPPPQDVLRDDNDGAEAPVPIQPPLLTSPDSNNEGQEICRVESSTSGSYSLEATPCASLSPAPPLEMDSVKPFQAALDSELLSVPPIAPSPAHPEAAAASTHPSAVATATAADRKTLKETMKLQFPPGSSMFSNSASPSTPARSSSGTTTTTGRRKHFTQQQSTTANQLSSTDSEQDNEEAGDRCTRKRRSNKNTSATAAAESAHGTTAQDSNKRPSSKHKKNTRHRDPLTPNNSFSIADGSVVRKRDSQIMSEVTTPGMVRSPAMHEGFRLADWDVVTPSLASAEAVEARNYFTLQHPSEGSFHDPDNMADMVGTSWNLMAPTSTPQQNCDSIRSASPGSDNVFVSETTAELSGNGGVPPPPEGFADSPATLAPDWGLPSPSTKISSSIVGGPSDSTNGENLETTKRKRDSGRGKRTKSCTLPATSNFSVSGLSLEAGTGDRNEVLPHRAVSTIDMWYPETQLPPKRQLTVRAKSEERERFNRPARRSVEASWDSLGSKLSVDGTPLDDEDAGIYNASYRAGAWAYIGETEELHVWRRSQPQTPLQETDDSSTASEKDFRRKYTSITHRMVHRKSSVEMFRRLATSTFECDDIVLVKRESGEFGFRIHGSRPVVVSAIEPGTPAELSGLQVGDILISINDVNVLDSSHSEVVRIAHIGTDELKLEVARTCNILSVNPMLAPDQPTTTTTGECIQQGTANNEAPILVGYLWKKSQSASRADESANNVWYRRWFVLKRDHCLYYYKNQDSSQPLGAVSLLHYTVTRTSFTERPHGLLLSKGGTIRHWLAAESTESVELWHSVFNHASKAAVQDVWLEMCARNIELPPASMASPDCVGHLMKLGHRAKEWQRRLCLLKDACLYFYVDINVSSALGALHLHGYRVQASGTTASSGERRKFAFELLPPEPRMRHFHFYTDSENDRKRWIAALEYSIDRWIRVG